MKLIGIDVGGTHTRIRVESPDDGARTDERLLTREWLTAEGLADSAGARALLERAYALGGSHDDPFAIGAHGCDSPAQVAEFRTAILRTHRGPAVVVNDAFLLAPAAGVASAIGVIVGTGSIVVGEDRGGGLIASGGHGWLIGDLGSAPGLVREAVLSVLRRHDAGLPVDPLGSAMLSAYAAADPAELSLVFTQTAGIHRWASAAPHVFEAADAGSADAAEVIRSAAEALADDVLHVLRRGAAAEAVVTAGGVIVNQPRLQNELRTSLEARRIPLPLIVLHDDPVSGAVELARRAAAERLTPTHTHQGGIQ